MMVGNSVLYVNYSENGVYDLTYNDTRGSYIGGDLSIIAKHLFEGHQIIGSAHATEPYGISYHIRDDGVLLTQTYEKDYNINAWTRFTTEGAVKSIATAFEDNEHHLYAIIDRDVGGTLKHFVERQATCEVATVAEAECLDCFFSRVTNSTPFDTMNVPHLVGKTVQAVGDGQYMGSFVVPASGVVTLPFAVSRAVVGLPYRPRMQLLDLAGGLQIGALRIKQKTVTMVTFEVIASLGLATGEDFDNLREWEYQRVEDGIGHTPLLEGQAEVYIPHMYNRKGDVVLQQNLPFPVKVVGVTRTFDVGD